MDAVKVIDEEFDGPTKLAALLSEVTGHKFTQPQVSNWKERGIPWRWRPVIDRLRAAKQSEAA